MPRFFMAGTNIKGGMAIMTGRDAEHVHVLRLRPGEDMIICDGQGTDYKCRLVKADKEQVEAEVVEVVRCPAEPTVKVTVLCGLPKGDKTDYIIQKSVEAGACEIMFFQSSRCVAKPDKPEKKLERWQRIAEEAAKLSGITVNSVKRRIYALGGIMCAIAAVIYIARIGSMDFANAGNGYEMDAIAAVIVGGTAMSGGRGSLIGAFLGMLIIGVMNNILNTVGVPTFLCEAVKGLIIIFAVLLQKKESA